MHLARSSEIIQISSTLRRLGKYIQTRKMAQPPRTQTASSAPPTTRPRKKSAFLSGVAGGLAGVCEIGVTMPLDTVKTQMQLSGERSAALQARRIFGSSKSLLSFYAGFTPMVTQVSCKAGIRFFAFEQIKAVLNQTLSSLPQTTANFLAGVGSGIVEAAVWVTPTERLKVLAQAGSGGGSGAGSGATTTPSSTTALARELYQTQGWKGFFVGFGPTAARQGVAMGIRFALYD